MGGRALQEAALRPMIATAAVLMVPLLAMQITDQVRWSAGDFVSAGALLLGTGMFYTLAAQLRGGRTYGAGLALALGAALLLVWVNLAVGMIGDEGNPVNLMYLGVLTIGAGGTLASRMRPRGLSGAMFAMALAQALVTAVALTLTLGAPANGAVEIVLGNGVFVALFAGAGGLFRMVPGRPEMINPNGS